jgi:hypothetical protein
MMQATQHLDSDVARALVRAARDTRRARTAQFAERAHPIEYDEAGFPIPQRRADFTTRVRQLLQR